MNRVFIIHGYKSYPGDCWFPWLKKELVKRGFHVFVPRFTGHNKPKLKEWLKKIKKVVGRSDEQTFFVTHSLGSITTLKYLETLKNGQKIGGVIFVGGRFKNPAKPQVTTFFSKVIDWKKIRKRSKKYVGIYSSNDYLVPLENGILAKRKLGAKLIIVKNKGHFMRRDKVFKLPIIIKEILRISSV